MATRARLPRDRAQPGSDPNTASREIRPLAATGNSGPFEDVRSVTAKVAAVGATSDGLHHLVEDVLGAMTGPWIALTQCDTIDLGRMEELIRSVTDRLVPCRVWPRSSTCIARRAE